MKLYQNRTYINDLDTAIEASCDIEKLKGQSVLITGATGTIGSFIVDMLVRYSELYDSKTEVFAAGRDVERMKLRFTGNKSERLHFFKYDLMKPVDFNYPINYVIHAAGNSYPEAFNTDPVGTIMGNIGGTYNLLETSRKNGLKRFLYVSSGEVYGCGDLSLESFEETYCGYIDSTSPRSCYPNSKRAAETLCSAYYKQYGLETVIVRPCHTYGPCIASYDNRAHAQFLRNVLNEEDIVLKSQGSQMRSYSYVADCASSIICALLKGKSGEAYNSANPYSRVTIAELAQIIAETAGRKVIYEMPSSKDVSNQTPILKQVLSSNKLESLGWRGQYNITKGITNTLTILKDVFEI